MAADGPTWVPHAFRALRHRNYRLYFLGQIVSWTGTFVQSTALTWLAYQLTHESKWSALIAAAQILPGFFLGPLGGALADRWPKRRLIFWTQATFGILALLLAVLVLAGVVVPWHLLAIALAGGLVNALDLPARLAFVMDLTGREDLMNGVALNSLLFNVARAVGPAIGGLLLTYLGAGTCFLVNALSYGAVLLALLAMDPPGTAHAGGDRGGLRSVWAAFGYLAGKPRLALLIGLAGALALFGWPYLVLMPALAELQLFPAEFAPGLAGLASAPAGGGPLLVATTLVAETARQAPVQAHGYSLLLSGTGCGALVAALVIAYYGSLARRRLLLGTGVWLTTVMLLGLSLAWGLSWDVAFSALVGAGLILFFATSQAVVQLSAPDHNRGAVMGIWSMTLSGALPAGNLLAGWTADQWGVPLTLQLLSLACGVAALAALGLLLAFPRAPAARRE